MSFKIVEHTADFAIRAEAGSLTDLLISLFEGWKSAAILVKTVRCSRRIKLSFTAETFEELAVEFIGELNFLSEVNQTVFISINHLGLTFDSGRISIEVVIEAADAVDSDFEIIREIKAVTFHQAELRNSDGLYSFSMFFDI